MIPVGYVVWGLDDLDVIDQLAWFRDRGAPAIGFHSSPALAPDRGLDIQRLTPADMTRLRDALDGFAGVEVHAPFDNYDIALTSPNPHVRAASLRTLAESLAFAHEIGADVVTVHSGNSRARPDRDARREALSESLAGLEQLAAEHGVPVAVEVADHFNDIAEFDLLDQLDGGHLGICLDTGHICFQREGRPAYETHGDIPGCIERFGERLIHVHLHDFRFADQRDHLGVGDGDLDIDSILAALVAIGYDGIVNLELAPDFVDPHDAPAHIEAVRERLRQRGVEV